jgi:mRNA interferase YafQ
MKLARKRGKDIAKLEQLLSILSEGGSLPAQYRDHELSGQWRHYRDCHLEPDWLLVYRIEGEDVYLARTGAHSEIF